MIVQKQEHFQDWKTIRWITKGIWNHSSSKHNSFPMIFLARASAVFTMVSVPCVIKIWLEVVFWQLCSMISRSESVISRLSTIISVFTSKSNEHLPLSKISFKCVSLKRVGLIQSYTPYQKYPLLQIFGSVVSWSFYY